MKEKQIQINELVAYCKQQVNPKKEPSTIVELRYQTPGRTWSEIHDIARDVANQLPSARSVFSAKAEPNGNITIFSRPCKEFVQLSSWLAKYAGYILEVDTVSRLSVSGKRSTYDVTGAEYLCYKPEECIKILSLLRKYRSTGDKICVSAKSDRYYGDRFNSYGEDRESEWSGSVSNYLQFSICTPSGREKKILRAICM